MPQADSIDPRLKAGLRVRFTAKPRNRLEELLVVLRMPFLNSLSLAIAMTFTASREAVVGYTFWA